jgi:hypothetical protein
MLGFLVRETARVYKGTLYDETTQRVADEDDWAVGASFQLQRHVLAYVWKDSTCLIEVGDHTFRLAARVEARVSAWLTTESRETPSVNAVTFAL